MTLIIAKPTGLTVGDNTIPFEERVRYTSGFYDAGSSASEDFFLRYAAHLAKQRGITHLNHIYTVGTSPNYFSYFLEREVINPHQLTPEFLVNSPKINTEEIVAAIPPFVKYLSITLPDTRRDLDKKLMDLETKLNSFRPKRIVEAIYIRPRASLSSLKLALTKGCTVNITY